MVHPPEAVPGKVYGATFVRIDESRILRLRVPMDEGFEAVEKRIGEGEMKLPEDWKGELKVHGYLSKTFPDNHRWSVWHTGARDIQIYRDGYLVREFIPLNQNDNLIKALLLTEIEEIEKAYNIPNHEYQTSGWKSQPIIPNKQPKGVMILVCTKCYCPIPQKTRSMDSEC